MEALILEFCRSYDVNGTPDKRQAFLHGEAILLESLRQVRLSKEALSNDMLTYHAVLRDAHQHMTKFRQAQAARKSLQLAKAAVPEHANICRKSPTRHASVADACQSVRHKRLTGMMVHVYRSLESFGSHPEIRMVCKMP